MLFQETKDGYVDSSDPIDPNAAPHQKSKSSSSTVKKEAQQMKRQYSNAILSQQKSPVKSSHRSSKERQMDDLVQKRLKQRGQSPLKIPKEFREDVLMSS